MFRLLIQVPALLQELVLENVGATDNQTAAFVRDLEITADLVSDTVSST